MDVGGLQIHAWAGCGSDCAVGSDQIRPGNGAPKQGHVYANRHSPSRNRPRKGIASDDHISLENDADPKSDTANVVGEIRDLTESLEEEARQNGAVAHLQQYLHALHIHALTSVQPVRVEVVNHPQERRRAASSVSDAPDSAIELSDDQASHIGTKQPAPLAYPNIKTPLDEVDELLDGLGERPSDAPVPPPRSSARRAPSNSTSQLQLHERRPSNSGSYSVSISSGNKIVTHHSPQNSGQRTPHTRSWSLSPSETQDSICEGYSTPGTDISGQSDHQSNFSLEKKRPDSETIGQPFDLTRLSGWENPRAEVPVPPVPDMMRSSTSSSSATSQSALPGTARRSSSRLSTALKGLRLGRRSSSRARDGREPEPPQDGEPRPGPVYLEPPRAVFGVSLSDSMQVAKGIGQDGYGSTESRKANSTRGYPLSVLRCVYFIQERGLQARHIFGQDADHILLAELKEVFSSVDTGYGKILDWDHFTVHEATNLILLFLAELPEPLVPPAAARRWVSLSRQATISGSMALRLDQGIDFWEEAFLGIHDPSRALLRLLLNMWGVVADMSEFNDMTAERLAGRVIRPLMHLPAARFDTDLMLGLAFMIRKRSEYQVKATGGGRRSNAAF